VSSTRPALHADDPQRPPPPAYEFAHLAHSPSARAAIAAALSLEASKKGATGPFRFPDLRKTLLGPRGAAFRSASEEDANFVTVACRHVASRRRTGGHRSRLRGPQADDDDADQHEGGAQQLQGRHGFVEPDETEPDGRERAQRADDGDRIRADAAQRLGRHEYRYGGADDSHPDRVRVDRWR